MAEPRDEEWLSLSDEVWLDLRAEERRDLRDGEWLA